MSLAPGSRIGPYEIVAAIGAGGMGEVYRAYDPRLERDVAIKVLPDAFSRDEDRLRRFEQEAKAAAGLNHPNILSVHDVGTEGGAPYVVSELLEGRTLREVLSGGVPPVHEALSYAAQVADALAAAHAKGIVHRDVKPENLFVTRQGRVKVLDFGLVKLAAGLTPPPATAATRTTFETVPGMLLGTAGYMSPEQAGGHPVDFRSDQFSLGIVIYEMLTGVQPFARPTAAQTITAVIEQAPRALTTVNPHISAPVASVVERCLAKNQESRYGSTADLARDLRGLADHASGRLAGAPNGRPGWAIGLSSAALLLVAGAAVWRFGLSPERSAGESAVTTSKLTQLTTAEGIERFPAWAPDGKRVAYSAEVNGHRKVFVKTLATGEERQVTSGVADDLQPTWGSDGGSIAYVRSHQLDGRLEPGDVFGTYDGGDVWSVDLPSGVESRILENAFNPSYSPDGQWLAVDASWAGPRRIWVVDHRGYNPKQVSSDTSEAVSHLMPRWSPDGKSLVFQNKETTTFDIKVVSVTTGASHWLTHDPVLDANPAWSSTGVIAFSSQRGGGINLWQMPVDLAGVPLGPPTQLTTGAGQDVEAAVSPDGRQISFVTLRQNADLWELPVAPATGALTGPSVRFVASSREDSRGAWSPDGRSLAFNSDRTEHMNIWLHSVEGGDRQLTTGPGGDYQPAWTPDGSRLFFFSSRGGTADIWAVDVRTGVLTRLTKGPSLHINPVVSPDGRLVAYQSDQDGRLTPWVMQVDGGNQQQLTRTGVLGHFMRWSADGKRVIFRVAAPDPKGLATLVEVPFEGGEPQPFCQIAGGSHFSLSPDRSRIIDVVGHKALWLSQPGGPPPVKLFEFAEPDARIDYPVWSPDGRFVIFDRFQPEGGDVWLLTGFRH